MKPTVNVIRAVGVEFIRRAVRPLIVIALIVAFVLLLIGVWLVSQNVWWWIFQGLLIIVTAALLTASIFIFTLMRIADPPQTRQQKRAVADFTDKLLRTTENIKTPYPLIIARIVLDVIQRRNGKDSFISQVSHDSVSLAPDFLALQRSFGDPTS